MSEPSGLSAAEAARRIRAGELSPVDLLSACLARIEATEPVVRAWVHLDGEAALRVARERETEAREGRFLGPLHGVPVALKDIFDAAGLPTRAGAGHFFHPTPAADATSVARLRAQGAVIVGKVTTTAFAYLDPSPTRNPWNPEHTPGGSSSGPAAAVAARMVPLALGSQTVGSVLRPAAYCGVVGRGILRVGANADLVALDPARVADRATYEDPHQYATGIEYVLVNGRVVIDRGEHTGALPGRVLTPL